MVNDFTGGSFMETNYHSQFDNDGFYDEDVYRMHHELFGLLLMAIDRTVVVPLDFPEYSEKQGSGWTANGVKNRRGWTAAFAGVGAGNGDGATAVCKGRENEPEREAR